MIKRLFAIGDINECFNKFQKLIEEKIQIKKMITPFCLANTSTEDLSAKILLITIYLQQNNHNN